MVSGVQQGRTAGNKSSTGGCCSRRFSEQEGGALSPGRRSPEQRVVGWNVRMKGYNRGALGFMQQEDDDERVLG